MSKWAFSDLVNIKTLQKMADHLYISAGIPAGVFDTNGNLLVGAGWQDICIKYHRVHPKANQRCQISDQYIKQHLYEGSFIGYKCLNNMWDFAFPIMVLGEHIATLFVGQFFYDDEVIDTEFFRKQAAGFGFDEEEYLSALHRVPIFSREKIGHMMEYYKGLVSTLVESSVSRLQYIEADEKLRKSEARLRNLFESMRDCVFVLDDDGTFIECYQTANTSLLAPPEVFIGKKYEQILPSEVSSLVSNAIMKLKRDEVVEPFDYSLKIADETLWYSAQLTKVRGTTNNTDGFMAVIRDITDKKKYEEELLKAKNEAEAANNVKNIFMTNITHELRTPVNVILSAIQLFELNLKDILEFNSFNGHKHLKSMRQNCQRLLRLVNNLIDITKIESGFMDLNLKTANIVSIVENITFSVAEYVKCKNLHIVFDTEIEEKITALDQDKIERIMLNILSNAIKFTKENGSIFVNIYNRKTSVVISVKDTGIGIPPDKINQIFERFIQVENSLIKSHEGSGIGLPLVKSFVDLHGGTITVLSELGVGSEFLIEIPVNTVSEKCLQSHNNINYNCMEMLNIEFSDIY